MYRLVFFSFLLGLFSFTPVKTSSITDPSIIGKWYSAAGFRYERNGNESSRGTWYEF
jgi:hypothetical protein